MSALYIKVNVARRPTSNKPRAIRIIAGYDERVTMNNALFYAEMGFSQLNEVSLKGVIKRAKDECKASRTEVKIASDVFKMAIA